MRTAFSLRRRLPALATLCLAAMIAAGCFSYKAASTPPKPVEVAEPLATAEPQTVAKARPEAKETTRESGPHSWPLFGGTVQRNLVNTFEKNIASDWNIEEKKNIKWVQELGSRSYGGPVISGGKIFVGTNNENPRNPAIKGDKGILICFDEKTGDFLWQAVHDKLPAGRVVDWPLQGICSSPVVEGNRLWYVSNRCEVVCADVNGDPAKKGEAKFVWTFDMMSKLNVFPHNVATCSPLIVGDRLFLITSNGVDE